MGFMPVITDSLAGVQPQASNPDQGGVDAPEVVVSGPKSLEEWDKALDEMTADQISALVSTPAASLPPAGEIAEVIAPAAPEPAAAPPQAEPSVALESPKGPPSRVRLNGVPAEAASRVTQYLDAIRSGKSPEEASAIFAPPASQTPIPADSPPTLAAPVAAPPASVTPPPAVTEIETRIAAATQDLEDAKASYDAVEISNHTLALVRLEIELDRAKVAASQEQIQLGNYDRIFDATVSDLVETNPDLANEASPLSLRLEELRDLESVRNPGFDDDPAFLVRLVERAKADVTGQPVNLQPQNPAVQRHRPLVGAVAPAGTTVSRAMTKEEAESQFDAHLARMTPDEQSEFLMNTLNIPA